jgi:hypothetical protein
MVRQHEEHNPKTKLTTLYSLLTVFSKAFSSQMPTYDSTQPE